MVAGGGHRRDGPEKLDLGQLAQTPLASGSSIALDEDLFTGPRSSGKSSPAAGKKAWVVREIHSDVLIVVHILLGRMHA